MTDNSPYSSEIDPLLSDALDLEQIQQQLARQRFPRQALETAYVAPLTPTEKALAEIWAELLRVEPIGIDDDFFMLGGHSIVATQALARVNELFAIEVPVSVFFSGDDFTVRALAKLVDQYQLGQADEGELATLLQELDGLSEEEIRNLLTKMD